MVPIDFDSYVTPLFMGHKFEQLINRICASCNNLFIPQELNPKRLHIICAHQGYHFSRKMLAQCLQMHVNNKMHQYDYGPKKNYIIYNSSEAPEYPLHQISNRHMGFIYCKHDFFVRWKDLVTLRSKLTGQYDTSFDS